MEVANACAPTCAVFAAYLQMRWTCAGVYHAMLGLACTSYGPSLGEICVAEPLSVAAQTTSLCPASMDTSTVTASFHPPPHTRATFRSSTTASSHSPPTISCCRTS
eukprot:391882-Rhodomonas_salina.6